MVEPNICGAENFEVAPKFVGKFEKTCVVINKITYFV